MSAWRKVVSVVTSLGGTLLARLECGHTATINPVPTAIEKPQSIVGSSVPCGTCPDPERVAS